MALASELAETWGAWHAALEGTGHAMTWQRAGARRLSERNRFTAYYAGTCGNCGLAMDVGAGWGGKAGGPKIASIRPRHCRKGGR